MIVVTGSVTAREDSFSEISKLSLKHVHRSRQEPGCISHAVHVDCENPLRLCSSNNGPIGPLCWRISPSPLRVISSARCSRSPLMPPPSSFTTRPGWKSCNA